MTFHLKESKATFSALKSRLFSAGKSPFQRTNRVFELRISNSKNGIPEQYRKVNENPHFWKVGFSPMFSNNGWKVKRYLISNPPRKQLFLRSGIWSRLSWGGILGRNWDKNFKTFASCYLQSPPTADFIPLLPWFSWTWDFYKKQLKVGGGLALYT